MFDAKSLLENLVRGAGQPQQTQGGGLGDILGQLAQGLGQPAATSARAQQTSESGGGLADILGKLQQQISAQSGGSASGKGAADGTPGGGLMEILAQVLNQATAGVKEGAQRVDEATGASGHVRDAIGQATGKTPEELASQLKDWIAKNPGSATAAAGSLGAVVLGTQAGRSLAGSAIRLGALALIGGLAYKAVQNYQQGKPLVADQKESLMEAPRGSGFEAAAVSHDAALLYIRGMIAAAAADGRIDAAEQQKIIGSLQQAGLEADAKEFLANELKHPATPEELAAAVTSQQEAVQLFTAARIAVDLDTREEHQFLVRLAKDLQMDPDLAAHIDATARAA